MNQAARRLTPISVLIELTYRCNLSCRHCYIPPGQLHPKSPSQKSSLTLKEWANIFTQLAESGTLFLTFTGGETLLYPKFPELLKIAREQRFTFRVFTNGTLITRETVKKLSRLHPFEVEISVYAADPRLHDLVTGRKGSFELTWNAIRMLKNEGIKVNLKTPVMTLNQKEVKPLRDLARDLDLPIQFSYVLSPRDDGNSAPLKLQLKTREIRACLSREYDSESCPDLAPNPGRKPGDPICSAGRNSLAISPAGKVYPCVQIRREAGDLRKEKFAAIWKKSPVLREIRGMTMAQVPECLSCRDLGFCSLCPGMSLILSDEVEEPYWPSCELARARAKGGKK
ncbi:MAG: radical SAM protein [bacterium]|nr:radical SAM protein [bacterium]